MPRLLDLLQVAVDRGASDLHVTVGQPPVLRVHGELVRMDAPNLTPADTNEMLDEVLADQHREVFKDWGEVDFSLSLPGIGRFRINAFRQRGTIGMACRLIPQAIERAEHILTIEDPIEFLHRHERSIVNQREVGSDTRSYAHGLRAALREDPDVILIGEMRDLETTQAAVSAAETGHLVLATLHTPGAAEAVHRILDIFPPYQQQQIRTQLALVLQAVISQQLLRRADRPGRVVAAEVLVVTPAIRNLIREGKVHQIHSMMQAGGQLGMQTMEQALQSLYQRGVISKAQMDLYAPEAGLLQRLLQR